MSSAHVERLDRSHEDQIDRLLAQAPVANLFLTGFLRTHPVDRAWWYGVHRIGVLSGVVMVLPARLAVPFTLRPDDATLLGEHLRSLHPPTLTVGPRAACDALWASWAPDTAPGRCHEQRLYVLTEPPDGTDPEGFRPARRGEWRRVAHHAGQMEQEDLGTNPYAAHPRLHEQVVQDRIAAGRTWVTEEAGVLVFQINVGTTTRVGCQIGGTYVPRVLRGKGHAKRGVAALGRVLLRNHPIVTLHVNEANTAAVRVYEAVGFARADAFRLITVAS